MAVHQSSRALPPFEGNLLDYHVRMMINRDWRREPVGEVDATWVFDNFDSFNRLCSEDEAFRLGLEAVIDWRYSKDARTAIARLWTGIEALFPVSSELVYRISAICACLLEDRGPARKAKFQVVKKVYGMRSKAVHGEKLTEVQLVDAMNDSFGVLRSLLVKIVERGKMMDSNELDDLLFT